MLAGATSVEELIEGLTIGVGSAIDPTVALITGLAIGVDNIAEALSIGGLQREETKERFAWPLRGANEATVAITGRELNWLLDGLDIFRARPHATLRYESVL